MMILIRLVLLSTLLNLAGCNLLELVYYDRAKFSFTDKNKETQYVFLCKKSKDQAETNKRFEQARVFFEQRMTAILEEYSSSLDNLIENSEIKEKKLSIRVDQIFNNLLKQSEDLGLQVEQKYQCLLFDSTELGDEGENESQMSHKKQSENDDHD